MIRTWVARSGVLMGALAFVIPFNPAAFAQGGQSTPGVTVTAQNPGTYGDGLRITLTAHAEQSTVQNPDCRPQSATITCWGSLVLRIPDAGGMSVSGFQVHRVAVGDTGCGDEESGGCEGGDMAAMAAEPPGYPVEAQVNGVAVLTDPGTLTYPPGTPQAGQPVAPGTTVQLKMTLTDNGTAQYRDQVDVQVNLFVSGSVKPLLYDTGAQTVQQVQIHFEGSS